MLTFPSPPNEPFLHVRMTNGGPSVRGDLEYFQGHRIGHADGVFATWTWTGQHLLAQSDRYAFSPLYYSATADELWISPSIPTLLREGVQPELDDVSLAILAHFGNLIGQRTLFRNIKAFPRGGVVRWENGQLSASDSFPQPKSGLSLSRKAAIDAYIDLFKSAIQRRASEGRESAVLLSGGRDSRHILLQLVGLGFNPSACHTVQLPVGETMESTIAAALAEQSNIPHKIFYAPYPSLSTYLSCFTKTQLSTYEHDGLTDFANTLDPDLSLYDGIGGDVLSAGLFMTTARVRQFEQGAFAELAEDFMSSRRPSILRQHFSREPLVGKAKEALIEELKLHRHAPNPVGSFMFWNRTRSNIALSPYRLFRRTSPVYAPYLDHELWDLLSGLPAEMLVDHTFHTETIHTAFPTYAHIPFYSPGRKAGLSWHTKTQLALQLLFILMRSKSRQVIATSRLVSIMIRTLVDPSYNGIGWIIREASHAVVLCQWMGLGQKRISH